MSNKIKVGDAFLDAVNHIHEKDHAALVMVDHEEGHTLIVERNSLEICLKAMINRYLDETNSALNYEPEKALLKLNDLLAQTVKDWRDEND